MEVDDSFIKSVSLTGKAGAGNNIGSVRSYSGHTCTKSLLISQGFLFQ